MRVVVLLNPSSGRGSAARWGDEIVAALKQRGHEVVLRRVGEVFHLESDLAPSQPSLPLGSPPGRTTLVVIGGDGTVQRVLDDLQATGSRLFHFPAGNENLLARHAGHRASVESALTHVESGRSRTMDLGVLRVFERDRQTMIGLPRRFALMASFGPDAAVIHRLNASPRRGPGHLAYARPLLAELWHPHPGVIRASAQRKRLADDAGWLVVANTPDYALGINPCPDADTTDGLLDVAFFPGRGLVGMLRRLPRCWLRRNDAAPDITRARTPQLSIESETHCQLDGEPGPPVRGKIINIAVEPAALTLCSI